MQPDKKPCQKMSTAQERTLAQYQSWMQVNASAHLIRTARELGVIDELRQGQRTAYQLSETLSLVPDSLGLLLDTLISIGIVERYEDDFALARAGHLLCQYDDDLGDATWARLANLVRGNDQRSGNNDQRQSDYLAATQWIHTPAAMQAAEILNIGDGGEFTGLKILDLGCGSGVWGCAMAHRDPDSTITAVDSAGALEATRVTADSIGLGGRLETIEADPLDVTLPTHEFDLVVLAQRIGCVGDEATKKLLGNAAAATKVGGRVVVIDLFRGRTRPDLAEGIEALKLELGTRAGRMRTLREVQAGLMEVGLERIQATFLPASRVNLGLAVGVRTSDGS